MSAYTGVAATLLQALGYRTGFTSSKYELKLGDVAGARRLYDALATLPGARGDLRGALLEAHLRAAERGPAPP